MQSVYEKLACSAPSPRKVRLSMAPSPFPASRRPLAGGIPARCPQKPDSVAGAERDFEPAGRCTGGELPCADGSSGELTSLDDVDPDESERLVARMLEVS